MRNLTKLAFRRVVIVSLALLLQIVVMVLLMVAFTEYAPWFNALMLIVALLLTLRIVSSDADPDYKIAWILPILAMPVFGVTVYLLFGGSRKSRRLKKRLRLASKTMQTCLRQDRHILDHLRAEDPAAEAPAYYLAGKAFCPIYERTKTEYFPVGERCYNRMLRDLRSAKQYIYLEYFIIERGRMWDGILEILREKAAQGVDVRVIYDDFGCITKLPSGYYKQLEAMGIRCRVFNPFIPVVSPLLNNRDHRKFMIIDGRIGYTGGINLADEYINAVRPFGHWKDCGIRLEGDAVWSMTVSFLSMWDFTRNEEERFAPFHPDPAHGGAEGYVQPYHDCPWDEEPVGQTVYLNLINRAKKYVYITTPYLIIDYSITMALTSAAKSGVDVRIITPHIPDKKTVFEVTRAYYQELLEAGVQIFEYEPGFIHSKNFVVDDLYATVGTVNLDYRSMFLHFENGVVLYDTPTVAEIRDDFLDTQTKCLMVTETECRLVPWYRKLVRSILKIFAPLL